MSPPPTRSGGGICNERGGAGSARAAWGGVGLRVECLGCRGQSVRDWNVRLRVQGSGFMVWSFGFGILGLGLGVWGSRFEVGVVGSGSKV